MIYCYFFNKKTLIQLFFDNNYSLDFKKVNISDDEINFDNFKSDLNETCYMDILFKK